MGKLNGRVAFVTGTARGQGRSHAVRLAQEGADIIAIDICDQIETVSYPMATAEDLVETVHQVESLDRRILARHVDVRDLAALTQVVAEGAAELGPVDIVLANAAIAPQGSPESDPAAMFRCVIDVDLTGVWATVMAAAPDMIANGKGGAIVLISSTLGLKGTGGNGSAALTAYTAAKHGVVGLMRTFAHWLAPHSIRVNTVHPSGVATPMILNEVMASFMAASPSAAEAAVNLLPIDLMEPMDVSNAITWLVSDEARYVTGVTLPVDAGFNAR